ncbi:MAG: PD40 domain-containing protein, partial [Acidobacteria bacterium]|nr:PD40 domain-containing protein [Acidobacteriota bacterium]
MGAQSPFFSPDSKQIAFFASGQLKRVPVDGGTPLTVCEVESPNGPHAGGGTWGENGIIVFAPAFGPGITLWHVPAAGGRAAPLLSLARDEWAQRWPQMLPDGRAVLYTAEDHPGDVNDANLVVQLLPAGERKIVLRGGYHGRYVPSGHLVYLHDGALLAVPFDLPQLRVTGPPTPLLHDVTSTTWTGGSQFSVSANGTLVFLPGKTTRGKSVQAIDRAGRVTATWADPANWFNIHLAPDGRRFSMEIFAGGTSDIWIYEWDRGTATPLTRHPGDDMKAVWSPSGGSLVFNSNRAGPPRSVYWQRANGIGDPQRLTNSETSQWPVSWHPSGRFLVFEQRNPETGWDLMILPMGGDDVSGWTAGTPAAFLNTPRNEKEPNFSPDGRWVAYQSDEMGRDEVYVRPFRAGGNGWRISTDGGSFPVWSRT